MIITALYIRGNNYKDEYNTELFAHNNTVLQYEKEITDIRLANEQALRIAQEESTANYKALVEKTSKIQKEYIDCEEDININIDKLSAFNDSLFEQIRKYSKSSNPSDSKSLPDSSQTKRIQKLSESLESCIGRKQFYAEDAARLNSSVTALEAWGDEIVKNTNRIGEKVGEKIE